MKLFLFCFIVFFVSASSAQNDFFILKKKDKNIKTYFKESFIDFSTVHGENFNGYIKKIQRDTV